MSNTLSTTPRPTAPPTGKAIASMVLGIIAVIPFSWIYALPGLVMGIIAIVFARQERRAGRPSAMATAGYVTGIVAVSLSALFLTLFTIAIAVALNQSA